MTLTGGGAVPKMPTMNLEVRKSSVRMWLLNKVGSRMNRILPAWIAARLWYRWIGWVPVMHYRIKGGKWQEITVRDVIDRKLADPHRGTKGPETGGRE